MASLTLLLHLLLMVSAASAWWWENRYYGGSVTFTPKRRHSNGTYEVEIRDKQATRDCYHNNYNCYYGNCGDQIQSTTIINGYNYYYYYYCQSETVTRRKLNSNLPFAIRYPTYYNQQNGEGYWWYNSRGGWDIGLEMMAHVDLGTRSDTGESNRPPVMSTMPVLQIPSNCPRSFKLAMFDPDGDQVRCRVPTDPSTYECALCGLPNGFSLDQDSCSITYTPTYNRYGYGYYSGSGYYPIELMVEDFSRKYISLFYSDGSSTSKYPFSWRRHKRQDPYAYMTAPTTTTAAPTSTTAAPRTTTAAPTTTTAAPRTTTAAPRTSTAAPTTTTAPPTTTTPFPTTTLFPMTTTVAPTTTAVTITVPTATVPYPSWVPSLSKLPLQFMANVMWDEAPSCIEGEYIPIFLSPTPSNGAILPAFVNHTLEIKVRTSGIYTTIDDLVVTGPSGISKTRISTEEFVITWTPTEEDVNDYFPICFVSEAHMTNYSNYYYYYNNYYHYISYNYQSELRCVIAEVVPETTVTCSETTMTVEVKKTYLMRRYRDKLRLNAFTDPSCDLQTHSNWTHLVAIFPLNACGTSAEEDGDHIILSNTITSADPNQIIYRNNDIEIPFSCAYQRQANLTLGYRHKNPYSFTEEGFGAFTYQFEFYDSQLFINPINASSYPVEVDLKQMMFMQIEATISIPNTVLFVESCIATPYDDPNSPISYSIIKNGCVKDKTVQIYNGSNSQFRFGMEAFEFIGAYPQVYITCSVIMCQADVPGTRCSQGCLPFHHHSKREATAQTRSHSISQGPLHLRTSDSRASGLSLNLGINLFFIVGCLLVCGVVIYRSRRFRTNYQVLPMSDSE